MGIEHDAPHGHRGATPGRRFRIITVVMVPVPGGFPGPLALPCSVHVHKVAPAARVVGRWGCPAPTPSCSHLLASGLTRPDWQLLLPPASTTVYAILTPSTPAGSSTAFRPALPGQRLRLGPDHHATVAPRSLRSLVRPHHRAALRPMSRGAGDCAAIAYLKGIRREETSPRMRDWRPFSLPTFVIRRI